MAEENKKPEEEKPNIDQASGEEAAKVNEVKEDSGAEASKERGGVGSKKDESQGETAENEADPEAKSSGKEKKDHDTLHRFWNSLLSHPIRLISFGGVILFLIILGFIFVTIGSQAAMNAYTVKKDEVSNQAYDMFYSSIYDAAESAHHVSNDVTISIGSLREENKLEVLKVSDVVYEITENEQSGGTIGNILSKIFNRTVDSWLKVPGSGIYTVDMQTAEFVIDNRHRYVLIRVMEPELTQFSIDYSNVEELYFKDNSIFHNPARVGVDLVISQLNDAEADLTDDISSSERIQESARNAAVNIITGLVRELNQDIPDLRVEVEFVNG